ncbi:MAG TPA: 50S ribosomal protein L18 [Longimicrobiaceae bacterium]|jgi:large subunit ribosomal protein L18|nr:50S ribosomal protein L18 [Longimicrobiaceae bacterium]
MARARIKTRQDRRLRRHRRVRGKVSGTQQRPRLVVYRSLKHVEGQVVDDTQGRTLVGLSTLAAPLREQRSADGMTKTEASRAAGKALAEKAREMGITAVVFDRGGYLYHGRVKAFAEGAREGGLEF